MRYSTVPVYPSPMLDQLYWIPNAIVWWKVNGDKALLQGHLVCDVLHCRLVELDDFIKFSLEHVCIQ